MTRNLPIKVQLNPLDRSLTHPHLEPHHQLFWTEIDHSLLPLYHAPHSFLYSAILTNHQGRYYAIARPWGQAVSSLTHSQLQSFFSEVHLYSILNIIVELHPFSARIDLDCLYYQNSQQPKVFVSRTCPQQQYLTNANQLIARLFFHIKGILLRNDAVKNMSDFEAWLREDKPQRHPKPIHQLTLLKLQPLPKENTHKIALSEEQRTWLLLATHHTQAQPMQLLYNGASQHFNPAPLLKVALKRNLLFLIETTDGKRAAFWMAAKPEISDHLFGQYYTDKTKKSLLLGLERRSVHPLGDENYSVGLGSEVLLSIGKTDIVLSAFNISNVSCFPCSYGKDQEKGVTKSQDLLGRQFTLRQLEAYGFDVK